MNIQLMIGLFLPFGAVYVNHFADRTEVSVARELPELTRLKLGFWGWERIGDAWVYRHPSGY